VFNTHREEFETTISMVAFVIITMVFRDIPNSIKMHLVEYDNNDCKAFISSII